MEVYLIRHGIAEAFREGFSDDERSLTERGWRKTEKVAERLKELKCHFDRILTSPLVRARQTAEILQKAGLGDRVQTFYPLAPDGDIREWLSWLPDSRCDRIALVGHQPDLGNWAETLVWGRSKEAIILKKAGIIGISLPDSADPVGCCHLFWLTPPKYLL